MWPVDAAVPEGSSVRVDMSTGQRWIETNSTGDIEMAQLLSKPQQEVGSPKGLAVSTATKTVDTAFRESVEKATRSEDPTLDEEVASTPEDKIASALGKLPEVEQERLARSVGRERLEDLTTSELWSVWQSRQDELREVSSTMRESWRVMTGRLSLLREFIESPASSRIDEVVRELEDLEYDLGDLDDARDFHYALKGTPTLVELLDKKWEPRIRAAAAAALGTSIKNEHDLQTEHGSLRILVDALSDADLELRKKMLYALGATLRNNRVAISQFKSVVAASGGGFGALADALQAALSNDLPAGWPVADKAATLIGDLALDLDKDDEDAGKVCTSVRDAILLHNPPVTRLERFLKAAQALVETCGGDGANNASAWDALPSRLEAMALDLRKKIGESPSSDNGEKQMKDETSYVEDLATLVLSLRDDLSKTLVVGEQGQRR